MLFRVEEAPKTLDLLDQVKKYGAFLEADGTVGFVSERGEVFRGDIGNSKFFLEAYLSVADLIDYGTIVRAIQPGETICITIPEAEASSPAPSNLVSKSS